jgi:Tol biopolymer transport system component
MKKTLLLSFIYLLAWQTPGYAAYFHDPDLSWQTLQSEHFEIHFHNGEEPLLPKVVEIAESAHRRVSQFFDWQPEQKTHLILTDRMDFSNAFAMPMPRNTMVIIVTPPDDVESIGDYHDWLDLVITHEYTHIIHIDKASGIAKGARDIFGRISLFFPNALQPLWIVEGIASYLESQIEPGIGRGNNSTYRSLMRLEVESGIKPLSQVNLPIVSWPAGITRYLYGVYFFNFLRDNYSEEQIKQWVDTYSNNLIPFLVNSNAKQVFAKKMDPLWAEFTEYLNKEFVPEINELKESGLVEGTRITHDSYLTGYPRATTNGDLFYLKNNWLNEPELMILPAGEETPRSVTDIRSGNFDIHPDAGVLLAQIDNFRNVNYFSDLYQIDIPSGRTTQLTQGQRYKHAIWSPDAKNIIAVHIKQGNTALHLLNAAGKYLKTLWQGTNYEVISTLDWHPGNNTVVAAVWRPKSRWNLEIFDLSTSQWKQLTSTPQTESQPQFTADGSGIVFSADYSGVTNLHQMDIGSGEITRLTNVLGGAISSTQLADGSGYYYMGQHSEGSDIYFLSSKETVNKNVSPEKQTGIVKKPNTTSEPNITDKDNTVENAAPYSALKDIYPTSWFPYLEFTDESSVIGFSTHGSDPLNWHQYGLALAVDLDNDWPLGNLIYSYDRWRVAFKLFLQRDIQIVRDNQDNVNSFRDSDTLTLEAVLPFFRYDNQWSIHAGISAEHKSDHEVKPGGIELPDKSDELIGLALTYNSARYYPRGISLENGVRWRFVAEDSDQLDSDYTGQVYSLDWRGYFDIAASHVISARLVSGSSTDSPNPFRLGGLNDGFFLANPAETLIEPTTMVFNKRDYALRGYKEGLTELVGSHMSLAEFEWRFPISLIERGLMVPPIGITKLHGKVFYSLGDAWYDDVESADYYESAGIEINANMFFGYFIPLNIRAGFAKGFDDRLGEEEYYLQLGLAF